MLPSTPYRYNGRFGNYTDAESGLVDMGARYYSSGLGRFLSRDSIGFAGGLNLYAYCAGDPVNFTDPDGNFVMLVTGAIGATVGAVGGFIGAEINGTEPWVGAGRGAVIGGVMGAPGGLLGGAVTGYLVAEGASCVLGGAIGGAIGGAVGNAVGQGAELALGWRKCFSWPEVVASGAFGGLLGALGGWFHGCFVAGTLVPTEHGFKAIERLKKGDLVWSRNPRNGKVELKRVLAVSKRNVHVVVTVALADARSGKVAEKITATSEHPFFVEGKGWVGAGHLGIGTQIVTRAGPRLVVKSVTPHRRAAGYEVYNFTVEGDHTYFVGAVGGGACVHNAADCSLFNPPGFEGTE